MYGRSSSIMQFILFLVATGIATSEASKFDFPEHLLGTNYSALDDFKFLDSVKPVDLGLDIYDDLASLDIRQALADAVLSDDPSLNQYTSHIGHPRLVNAIAKWYSILLNRKLNPEENIIVTFGATEAAYLSFHGHTSPGDEWIVIEPSYTMYLPMIKQARGVPRFTTLKLRKTTGRITGDDWVLDRKEMESLFNNRTKGILINNPLNPIGKVYSLNDLLFIGSLAKKYNTMIISDEAHEYITHKPHIRIASLPGMFERTITLGSVSKSFSLAGWRLGWAYGPSHLMNQLTTVHYRTADSCGTPQQEAMGYAFEKEIRNVGTSNSEFAIRLKEIKQHRDYMLKVFFDVGMYPVIPDGGNCMIVNWTTLKNIPIKKGKHTDYDFLGWFIQNIGVLGLPMSSFYSEQNRHLGYDYIRFCFHKKSETIFNAAKKLRSLKDFDG